jgi:uncharacterized protein (DUF58 family)
VTKAEMTEIPLRWRLSRHARRLLTLGLTGIFVATLSRRPEFAGAAAPALLLLAAGRGTRPPAVAVSVRATSGRAFEGETVGLDLRASGAGVGDDYTVRWSIRLGKGLDPVGATAADGAQAQLMVTPERWGRRHLGTLDLVLRDRWRLTEGHARINLARLDCYPQPARLDTRGVLSRLPNRLGEHAANLG